MAAIDRGADFSIWSDDMRGAIRRRLNECGGIALITLAVIMAVALATWSVQDPSLSHATDAPVRNLLGTPGAIGSDLLMQLLGLASTVLVIPVAVWGWADPGESVTVRFADQSKTTTAGTGGGWSLKLDALQASADLEIRNLLRGLAGQRVPPGPSGAPTRGRIDVLRPLDDSKIVEFRFAFLAADPRVDETDRLTRIV